MEVPGSMEHTARRVVGEVEATAAEVPAAQELVVLWERRRTTRTRICCCVSC